MPSLPTWENPASHPQICRLGSLETQKGDLLIHYYVVLVLHSVMPRVSSIDTTNSGNERIDVIFFFAGLLLLVSCCLVLLDQGGGLLPPVARSPRTDDSSVHSIWLVA